MQVDFSSILEKSRSLAEILHTDTGSATVPRLERNLAQIHEFSQSLTQQASKKAPTEQHESNALQILSEYGFAPNQLERTVQSIALHDTLEPQSAFADTDIPAHLKHEHEMTVLNAIEYARKQSFDDSLNQSILYVEKEWSDMKKSLIQEDYINSIDTNAHISNLDAGNSQRSKDPKNSQQSYYAKPFRGIDSFNQRNQVWGIEDIKYMETIRKALHSRGTGTHIPVASEMQKASQVVHSSPYLQSCFGALRFMTGEISGVPKQEGAFTDSNLTQSYVVNGAREFLESQFKENKLRATIESNRVLAQRGGEPGFQADIRAYLNVIFDHTIPDFLITGPKFHSLPLWPQIYYALRCGDIPTAAQIVSQSRNLIESDGDLYFAKFFDAYINPESNRCLNDELLAELVQEYSLKLLHASNRNDPFRRACYVYLSRLDPATCEKITLLDDDYAILFACIEDYLWLQLSLLRLNVDHKPAMELGVSYITLTGLQKEMLEYGPAHFDPRGDNSFFYTLVLILCCRFKDAIEYLSRIDRHFPRAFHLAYVLYYYGIIEDKAQQKEKDTESFATMLWRFISRFMMYDAANAALYIFILRDRETRNSLLKQLLLATSNFEVLLGTSSIGRVKQKGVLEELWRLGEGQSDFWLSIVNAAANDALLSGDNEKAYLLYNLAGNKTKVLTLLLHKLSHLLNQKKNPARAETLKEAQEFKTSIERDQSSIVYDNNEIRSLVIMLGLYNFYELYWEGNIFKAWDQLKKMNLLPLEDSSLIQKTRELHPNSHEYSTFVTECIPDVLITAMEVLSKLYLESRYMSRNYYRDSVEAIASMEEYSQYAKVLVKFAGMMPYPNADVSAKLIQLEVLMS